MASGFLDLTGLKKLVSLIQGMPDDSTLEYTNNLHVKDGGINAKHIASGRALVDLTNDKNKVLTNTGGNAEWQYVNIPNSVDIVYKDGQSPSYSTSGKIAGTNSQKTFCCGDKFYSISMEDSASPHCYSVNESFVVEDVGALNEGGRSTVFFRDALTMLDGSAFVMYPFYNSSSSTVSAVVDKFASSGVRSKVYSIDIGSTSTLGSYYTASVGHDGKPIVFYGANLKQIVKFVNDSGVVETVNVVYDNVDGKNIGVEKNSDAAVCRIGRKLVVIGGLNVYVVDLDNGVAEYLIYDFGKGDISNLISFGSTCIVSGGKIIISTPYAMAYDGSNVKMLQISGEKLALGTIKQRLQANESFIVIARDKEVCIADSNCSNYTSFYLQEDSSGSPRFCSIFNPTTGKVFYAKSATSSSSKGCFRLFETNISEQLLS